MNLPAEVRRPMMGDLSWVLPMVIMLLVIYTTNYYAFKSQGIFKRTIDDPLGTLQKPRRFLTLYAIILHYLGLFLYLAGISSALLLKNGETIFLLFIISSVLSVMTSALLFVFSGSLRKK